MVSFRRDDHKYQLHDYWFIYVINQLLLMVQEKYKTIFNVYSTYFSHLHNSITIIMVNLVDPATTKI